MVFFRGRTLNSGSNGFVIREDPTYHFKRAVCLSVFLDDDPDGHDGHRQHGHERDHPAQHIGPHRERHVTVRRRCEVGPREHENHLLENEIRERKHENHLLENEIRERKHENHLLENEIRERKHENHLLENEIRERKHENHLLENENTRITCWRTKLENENTRITC